jgi:hypothetical protein
VVLTRREAAIARAVCLRHGSERVEELLGVCHHTAWKAAAQGPLSAATAEQIRERLWQLNCQTVRRSRI